jgi:lysophospholipase L1-like esterase
MTDERSRRRAARARRFALAAVLVVAMGCDDAALKVAAPSGGALFTRYVALGNSLTAGFESGGINDSTQRNAYPLRLAEAFGLQVGETFHYPALTAPGCPPPLTNVFTQTRLSTVACAFRDGNLPPFLSNVAVPGAAVLDLTTNLAPDSRPNSLTSFILGGQTQVEAARRAEPTFMTVWIGNNDILGTLSAADAGTDGIATPAAFGTLYAALMDSLNAIPTLQGGVLIGVVRPTLAPYAIAGSAFAAAAGAIPTLTVDPNCLAKAPIAGSADSAGALVPFDVAGPLVSAALGGAATTVDCSGPEVITPTEHAVIIATVEAYNATIAAAAQDRGWAFWDPNALLETLVLDPTKIRPFPAFDPADPQHQNAPFGTILSLDGVHPSAAGQIIIAEALADVIDAQYNTTVGVVLRGAVTSR